MLESLSGIRCKLCDNNFGDKTNAIPPPSTNLVDQDEIQVYGEVLDVFFCEDDDTKEFKEKDKKEVLKLHNYFAQRSGFLEKM